MGVRSRQRGWFFSYLQIVALRKRSGHQIIQAVGEGREESGLGESPSFYPNSPALAPG